MVVALVLLAQLIALAVLVNRLSAGAKREPPLRPVTEAVEDTSVSIIVPTLNEVARVGPLLAGLARQGAPLLEVLVVDSNSSDGTRELVNTAARNDSRIRLLTDPPLPPGWVGKVWALQHGLSHARGEWVLGLDADIEPEPELVATVVEVARRKSLPVVSFSPRFDGQTPAERLVHPSLLLTLIYRVGAPSSAAHPDRVMANGQCFLARRDVLARYGGYAAARESFADDVALARYLARMGVPIGFLDGSRLFRVRSYTSLGEMWREWGRSLDLRDATRWWRQVGDVALLAAVQGLPLPLILVAAVGGVKGTLAAWLVGVNVLLLALRGAMLFAIAPSYERRGVPYWLSPLSDPLAFVRIVWSSIRRPSVWRGRRYAKGDMASQAETPLAPQ